MKVIKIPVNLHSYKDAEDILRSYSEQPRYLVDLISRYSPGSLDFNSRNVSPEDRTKMLRYGRTIKSVAQKIIKSKKKPVKATSWRQPSLFED